MRFLSVTLFILTLALTTLSAQQGRGPRGNGDVPLITLSGMVVDSAKGGPLPRATVTIRRQSDSSLVTGAICGVDGRFTIEGLRPGRYYARVSYVGYMIRLIDDLPIRPGGGATIDLGNIALTPAAANGSINITAQRDFMTAEIDRTTYRADDILAAQGGDATDVLKNIPSIEVDPEGKVSLRGNENVVVLVDGRPSILSGDQLTLYLQTLPAGSIDRVEVIPNPSARFDPDGVSGIINIVRKKGDGSEGISGGVNVGIGTRDNYNAGLNIAWTSGPLTLIGTYGLGLNTRNFSSSRYRENYLPTGTTYLTDVDDGRRQGMGNNAGLNLEYRVSESSIIGASGSIGFRDGSNSGVSVYTDLDSLRAPLSLRIRSNSGDGSNRDIDGRLFYHWTDAASREDLSAEARYSTDNDEDLTDYRDEIATPSGTIIDTVPGLQNTRDEDDRRTITGQIDYTRPFEDGGRLETGYKGEALRLDGSIYSETYDYGAGEFRPDSGVNNSYTYDRTIHALYANYGRQFGDFGAQVGLRAEQALTTFDAKTTGESFDNDYFSLFPSGYVTWKPQDDLQFKASYSRRVNRPRTRELNPFPSFNDPLFRRVGNPNLKPEYIDAYEISTTWYHPAGILTLTPYFRRTTDVIERYERLDPDGVTYFTSDNFASSESFGSEIIGTAKIGPVQLTANGNLYRYQTDGSNLETDQSSSDLTWSTRLSATWKVTNWFDAQASWFYRAPRAIAGGTMEAMKNLDASVRVALLDDQVRVGLRASDILGQHGFSVTRTTDLYYDESTRSFDARRVVLSINYIFGSVRQKERNREERNREMEDDDFE